MKKKGDASINLADINFVKARYEYCLQLYRIEQERKEIIEKKAQFYLSVITLFFSALVLKLDFITEIGQIALSKPSSKETIILYIVGGVFFISLVIALIFVLFSVHMRGYLIEHPADLISALFNADSEYLATSTDVALYTSTAKSFALATESDRMINARKSEWVRLSSFFLLIAFLSFVIVFGIIVFLKLH